MNWHAIATVLGVVAAVFSMLALIWFMDENA
jgi:hypothetical protein